MPKLVIPTKAEIVREVFNDPEQDKTVLSELVADLPKELRLKGISEDELRDRVSVEKRLEGLTADDVKQLTREQVTELAKLFVEQAAKLDTLEQGTSE